MCLDLSLCLLHVQELLGIDPNQGHRTQASRSLPFSAYRLGASFLQALKLHNSLDKKSGSTRCLQLSLLQMESLQMESGSLVWVRSSHVVLKLPAWCARSSQGMRNATTNPLPGIENFALGRECAGCSLGRVPGLRTHEPTFREVRDCDK